MGKKNRKTQKTSGALENTSNPVSPCKVLSYAEMAKKRISASCESPVSPHTANTQNGSPSPDKLENLSPSSSCSSSLPSTSHQSFQSVIYTSDFDSSFYEELGYEGYQDSCPKHVCYVCHLIVRKTDFYDHMRKKGHRKRERRIKLTADEKIDQDKRTLVMKSK